MRIRVSFFGAAFAIAASFFVLTAVPSAFAQAAKAPSVLITGSNRGIGLEFVRQYAARGWFVIATTRKPEEAHRLRAIADANDNVVVELLDVTNGSHVSDLARKYEGQPIDVLVNNAGATGDFVGPSQAFGSLDHEELDNLMSVNGFGPLRVTEAFYENVRMSKQKKVIAITALLGVHSFGYGRFSGGYGYKLSKATLNAAMAILAGEAEEDGVIVALLTPGEVAVEKVKNPGPRFIEPDVSISGMIEVIDSLTLEDTGTIIRYNGKRYDF